MSDAGRPINELLDKVAAQVEETDRLIGHDASTPAAFRLAINELRKVMLRNEAGVPFYAEGSFTPGLGGNTANPTVTYGTRGGTYTRIGSLVTVALRMSTTARSGGSGALLITGLPFPVAAVAGTSTAAGSAEVENIALSAVPLTVGVHVIPVSGSTTAQLSQMFSGDSTLGIAIGAWEPTGRLRTTFSYFTDYTNPL